MSMLEGSIYKLHQLYTNYSRGSWADLITIDWQCFCLLFYRSRVNENHIKFAIVIEKKPTSCVIKWILGPINVCQSFWQKTNQFNNHPLQRFKYHKSPWQNSQLWMGEKRVVCHKICWQQNALKRHFSSPIKLCWR